MIEIFILVITIQMCYIDNAKRETYASGLPLNK